MEHLKIIYFKRNAVAKLNKHRHVFIHNYLFFSYNNIKITVYIHIVIVTKKTKKLNKYELKLL